MAIDAASLLYETTLATSAATLLVLALRLPARRLFGAGAAYSLWWLVPAALAAVLLPAAVAPVVPVIHEAVRATAMGALPASVSATAGRSPDGLAAVWAVGVIATLLVMAWRQRRFVAGLGPLQRAPDGHLRSVAVRGLPAVIGLRPRIVLPGDFEQRYSAPERALVLAHERVHLRRGDVPACALAALLRALFWFNPLLHAAVSLFRGDQELACDAAVLQSHPDQRRTYGEALLKTRLAADPLPFGCHWYETHPLKERISMLTHPLPSSTRRVAGLLLSFAAVCAGATAAWAVQPAAAVPSGRIGLAMEVKVDDGAARTLSAVLTPGVPHVFAFDAGDEHWRIESTVLTTGGGGFDLAAKISRDGEVVGEPRLLFEDSGAAIGIGEKRPDGSFDGIAIELRATAGPGAPEGGANAETKPAEDVIATAESGMASPPYPPEALARGEGGVVMLELRVSATGRVLESRYVADGSTVPESSPLVQSSRDAAAQWNLAPATMKDGKPAEGLVRVPVTFEPGEG